MTQEKLKQVIETYRNKFIELGIGKMSYSHEEVLIPGPSALEHCHSMLDQMKIFIQENRLDKVFRWLGFIQGVLWTHKVYTLEDLKNQNKKDVDSHI